MNDEPAAWLHQCGAATPWPPGQPIDFAAPFAYLCCSGCGYEIKPEHVEAEVTPLYTRAQA
jgi:hypothetical protein